MLARWLNVAVVLAAINSAASGQTERPLDSIAAKLEPARRVVYKTVGDRELSLYIFEPEGHAAADRRPVFLAIHGGGWTGGNARRFYPIAEHFTHSGLLGVSLEYRLINREQGTTVFDCVRDGRSAVRYLRSHAAELGIDPDRIVVAGGSAGGHVAAGTMLFDGVDEPGEDTSVSCRPNAAVLYYPVIDTSENGYGQTKIGDRWRELSPVHNVAGDLPPTILFHGTADTVTPFAGAVKFQKRMREQGNVCELITHKDGRHGYFIFDLELFEEAMTQTEEFLRGQGMILTPDCY